MIKESWRDMEEYNRQDLVNHQIERSLSIMAEIDILIAYKLWSTTANRLYYALFHAACALLIKDSHPVKSHQGVSMSLGHFYVTEGKLTREEGKFYGRMQGLREKSDYNCAIQVSEDEVKGYILPTRNLVTRLIELAKE